MSIRIPLIVQIIFSFFVIHIFATGILFPCQTKAQELDLQNSSEKLESGDLCFEYQGLRFKYIEQGKFKMGSLGNYSDERPVSIVATNSFCIMETPLKGTISQLLESSNKEYNQDDVSFMINHFGDNGRKIRAKIGEKLNLLDVQIILKALGYYHDTVDGLMGPNTRSAITTFQKNQQLPQSKELLDIDTRNRMIAVYRDTQFKGLLNQDLEELSWQQAIDLGVWISKKTKKEIRLPTEAEWEFAARGGLVGKRYPWGDLNDNFGKISVKDIVVAIMSRGCRNHEFSSYISDEKIIECLNNYNDNCFPPGYLPKIPKNGYGLQKLAGGWEWTSSKYMPYPYVANDGREEINSDSNSMRVLRGGATQWEFCDFSVSLRGYGRAKSTYSVRFVLEP